MSRMLPYRSKMPVQIIRALDVATRITLFMVGQSGPLSFTFKDRLDNKYKTSIGADLKCSCSPNKHDHCIHTLYIILKIFKVSPQNPIIWQAAYVDSQLSDLLSGKYTVITNRSRVIMPLFDEGQSAQLPSNFLERRSRQKQISKYTIEKANAERMKLNEDSVCPICQQQMTSDMCLVYCKVKCGNNFHAQCIKVWAEHKKTTQTQISCPMCRSPLGNVFLMQIQMVQRKYKKAQLQKIKIKYKCSGCGLTDIPKNVHKCILCKSYELCQACYDSNKHIKHQFITQCSQDGKWRGAHQRRAAQIKLKAFIDNKRKQKNVNEKLIQKLRKVEEDPAKLLDFVASAYPYVSKYISDNIDPHRKLDFNPQQMRCMKCNAKKMLFLRRLTCGHFIDHECLKQNIRKQRFHCEQCGVKIIKGYQNLVQKEKQNENKKQKQGIRLQVNDQFDPIKMQANHRHHNLNANEDDYNFVLPQQATLGDILGRLRDVMHEEEPSERLQHRLSNNIVRGYQTQSHHNIQQHRHNRMNSQHHNKPKRQIERQSIPHNNNIRIRNVARSTTNNGSHVSSTKNKTSKYDNANSNMASRRNARNRQDFGQMIQAMIGRKVF